MIFHRAIIEPIDLSRLDWFTEASMKRLMSARGRAIIGVRHIALEVMLYNSMNERRAHIAHYLNQSRMDIYLLVRPSIGCRAYRVQYP